MVQLSSDCFAFGDALMAVDDAVALIADRIPPVTGVETVDLASGDGRVLAQDIVAAAALPPFDNAAVDGYAVRWSDLAPEGPSILPVAGRVAAGAPASAAPIGAAVRIFTGAPMPAGADTVFMQEDVTRVGDSVTLPHGLKAGANRRLAGEDVPAGATVLTRGRVLTPQDIALCAAVGRAMLTVRRRLRVAVLSTGDEIVAPGQPLRPAALYDSNRFALQALLGRLGVVVSDLGILPDDRAAISAALAAAAAGHDLIVTSGGVSAGEEDHVRAAVEETGALTFWRLAIKPGRPVAMGMVAGTPFVGLPGNPVAVFVTFAHVVRPLIAALSGADPARPMALPVIADFAYGKKPGRREYVRVSLRRGEDGVVRASKHRRDGAGVITSLTETDGLVELPEAATAVAPGDVVGFFPYAILR